MIYEYVTNNWVEIYAQNTNYLGFLTVHKNHIKVYVFIKKKLFYYYLQYKQF